MSSILIIQLWFAVIVGGVITFFLLKLRHAGKTRVVLLKPNRTYKTGAVKTEGNKLKIRKDYQPNFETIDIFEEKKAPYIFWRNPRRLVFLCENANKALSFVTDSKTKSLKPTDLFYHWSPEEIREFTKKLAKKAAVEHRPMSQSMFIILLILCGGTLLLSLLTAMNIGVF